MLAHRHLKGEASCGVAVLLQKEVYIGVGTSCFFTYSFLFVSRGTERLSLGIQRRLMSFLVKRKVDQAAIAVSREKSPTPRRLVNRSRITFPVSVSCVLRNPSLRLKSLCSRTSTIVFVRWSTEKQRRIMGASSCFTSPRSLFCLIFSASLLSNSSVPSADRPSFTHES